MSKKPLLTNILMIGFGNQGQAVLPLLFDYFDIKPEQITIITATEEGNAVAEHYHIRPIILTLTPNNYKSIILEYLRKGSILFNISVDVSSIDLMKTCFEVGAMYMDTSIEPWAGGYVDERLSVSQRSNYALREQALALRAQYPKGPTALLAHGANPGLVSHMVKRSLLTIAKDLGMNSSTPADQKGWADLAQKLEVKVIHVAEQDKQYYKKERRRGEFLNTWSVEGLISEGCQPAELGWGSHEKVLPEDGCRHEFGCQAAIYLNKPGLMTRVRSWAPIAGPYMGYLITHNEAISISDYFTVKENGKASYRPTVHYSYQPSSAALLSIHEFLGNQMKKPLSQRVIKEDIESGVDELGVLLMGHPKGAYWYGSQLSIEEARRLAPFNNATSLQVASGMLAGLVWVVNHPNEGIVESEQMDHEEVLKVAEPYLGKLVGAYSDWTPLKDRLNLFPENIDRTDPWQFINFRV